MSKSEDDQARINEIISKLEIKTGVGDPSSPYFKQLLTEEEEAKLDPSGNPVVDGSRWSDCSTGLYLTVAVGAARGGTLEVNRRTLGGGTMPVSMALSSAGLVLSCITTRGKPAFRTDTAGASLELPEDLARDNLKRKYVVEWLRDTAAEALALYGVDLSANKAAYQHLGLTVAMTAENAIRATGL